MIDLYKEKAKEYVKFEKKGTYFLQHTAVESYLNDAYPENRKNLCVLDYGCGSGDSIKFLKTLGFKKITGFDVSPAMIAEGKRLDPDFDGQIITNTFPWDFHKESFDFIYSQFVIPALETKQTLIDYIQRMQEMLKPKGRALIVTTSGYNPRYKWISWENHPNNTDLFNEGPVSIIMTDGKNRLPLEDTFWESSFLMGLFQKKGFCVTHHLQPLGKEEDPYEWLSEKEISPFSIYGLQKR